jgi:hypothetical protein
LLGLFIKGGIWIGFAGAFLGIGLSGKGYRPLEIALVRVGLLALTYVGVRALNEPFDPARKILPRLYFSHDWYWKPDADFKPRREIWGGLLLTFVGLVGYVPSAIAAPHLHCPVRHSSGSIYRTHQDSRGAKKIPSF